MLKSPRLFCTALVANVLFSGTALASGYQISISCGDTFPEYVEQCFTDSNLVLEIGNKKTVYGADGYPINSLGYKLDKGMAMDVPEHFAIKAKNSSETQQLSILMINDDGKVIKENQAEEGEEIFIEE